MSFPHSIAHLMSRLDRYMPGGRLASRHDRGPVEVMDLAVGEMHTDGRVGQTPDDKAEQAALDLLTFGWLIPEGASVLPITVLHIGNADQLAAALDADDEHSLAGEAA